ncbi:MAG: endonuclease/exonuclease/phosphatase family protein [Niabella sp.]
MKFRLFTLMLLVCLGAGAQSFTVMTFNIYHGEEHYTPGRSNVQRVAAIINKYKPDFVALQEVDSMTRRSAALNNGVPQDFMQELAKLTGMNGFFAKAIDYSNGGYGEGLLARKPVNIKKYALPTPKGGEGRALIEATYQINKRKKIIFAGTHLCHEFDENRVAQAAKIVEIYKSSKIPVMIGGDWNFTPTSEGYHTITEQFKDAALLYGNPENTFSYDDPKYRIDFIFLSKNVPWKVKSVKLINENPSDHKALLVELSAGK